MIDWSQTSAVKLYISQQLQLFVTSDQLTERWNVLYGLQKQYREAEASALRASSTSVGIADTDEGHYLLPFTACDKLYLWLEQKIISHDCVHSLPELYCFLYCFFCSSKNTYYSYVNFLWPVMLNKCILIYWFYHAEWMQQPPRKAAL